jgi:hypothetical protein
MPYEYFFQTFQKNILSKCVLDFNFAPIKGSVFTLQDSNQESLDSEQERLESQQERRGNEKKRLDSQQER